MKIEFVLFLTFLAPRWYQYRLVAHSSAAWYRFSLDSCEAKLPKTEDFS